MLRILLPLLGTLLISAGWVQRDPIAHWILRADHFEGRKFHLGEKAEDLPWPATLSVEPKWLGEGSKSALLFAAGDAGIRVAAAVTAEDLPRRAMTVTAWVALDHSPAWGGFVSCFEDNGSHERGWMLGNRNRKFCFALASEERGKLHYLNANAEFQLGRWYHVAGVYDGKRQQIFVDGKLAGEIEGKKSPILYDVKHEMVLAAYKDQNENYPLLGAMAEVRLYDRALPPSKIKNLARQDRSTLPLIADRRVTQSDPTPTRSALRPEVNRAVESGVTWLLSRQNRDGSWDQHHDGYRNGITSLNALALLESGLSPRHPAIQNAKRFLLESPPTKTYSAGLQLMFLAELHTAGLEDPDLVLAAKEIVGDLLSWEKRPPGGMWGYPGGTPDVSNTQFAALGLWAADRMDISVPSRLWPDMVKTAIRSCMKGRETVEQVLADGSRVETDIEGFSYYANDQQYPAYGGMVAAGLGILALSEQVQTRLSPDLNRQFSAAKKRALGWLEYYFRVDAVPGYSERLQYYLYGLERIGSLWNLESFGPHQWYREGAAQLVKTQKADGKWQHSEFGTRSECATSFALMFLNRATAVTTSPDGSRTLASGFFAQKEGPVHLRATGGQPLTVWVTQMQRPDGKPWKEARRPETRAIQTRFFLNGDVVATIGLASAPDGRFAALLPIAKPGTYALTAEVAFQDGLVLAASPLAVQIERDPEAFQRAALPRRGPNLLAMARPEISVSTAAKNWPDQYAVDFFQGTAWVHAKDDPNPWIRFRCPRSVKATRLVLSPVDAKLIHENRATHLDKIRVLVNDKEELAWNLDWPVDPMAELQLRFPKELSVRTLQIWIVEQDSTDTQWKNQTGCAEVALMGPGI